MDRSDVRFWRCTSNAVEAQRVLTRRSVLSGAAGLAGLASARSGFARAPEENDLTMGRYGTMDIKRNGSRPSGRGPEAWFTGTVRVDPMFQVGDPLRLSGGQVTFEPGARTMWHTHPLGPLSSRQAWAGCNARVDRLRKSAPATSSAFHLARSIGTARQRRPR